MWAAAGLIASQEARSLAYLPQLQWLSVALSPDHPASIVVSVAYQGDRVCGFVRSFGQLTATIDLVQEDPLSTISRATFARLIAENVDNPISTRLFSK